MKNLLIIILLLILLTLNVSAQAADLWTTPSVGHDVYTFFDRLQAKGLIAPQSQMNPVTRQEISAQLKLLVEQVRNNPYCLSITEKKRLADYQLEFADELPLDYRLPDNAKNRFFRPRIIDNRLHKRYLLTYDYEENSFYLDIFFNEDVMMRTFSDFYNDSQLFTHSGGGMLRGNLGNNFGFFIHAANYRVDGDDDNAGLDQNPGLIKDFGSYSTYDKTDAYICLKLPWFHFKFGKDLLTWGPGYSGKLSVSENAGSFDQFLLTTQINIFKFTYLHGFLDSGMTDMKEDAQGNIWKETVSKYIAGHRLETFLGQKIIIGLHEIVIYGHRGIEPAYLNPFNFYRSAEHYLDDKDNAMMQIDLTILPVKNLTINGTWFIDDLYMAKFFDHVYNNKFGAQFGLYYAGFTDLDLKVEYTRVDQWVYSHYLSINTYTHNDRLIGHWIGPDSDLIFFSADYFFNYRLHGSIIAYQLRAGDVSDFQIPYTDRETDAKRFLEGIVEKRYVTQVNLEYQPYDGLTFTCGLEFCQLSNENNQENKDYRKFSTVFKMSVIY